MIATVYKSTGSWYNLRDDAGKLYTGRIKGVLKLEDISSTNPVAVGDRVEAEPEPEHPDQLMITRVQPRRNYINRQSPANKNQHHIVAANIDQSMLFATLREPRTSQGFIDRFLVTCEAYHVPAIIVINKVDLFRQKEEDQFLDWKEMYETIGYRVIRSSHMTGEGLEELKQSLLDKITLLSGHSGVGKSTFINHCFPGLRLKTQDVSGWSGKGLHTTTFAEMFDLPGGGRIIDTPGMREFGLVDISRQELSHYFPEMRTMISDCQFNNCLHLNEPGCAVKQAVLEGRIHEDRYVSYAMMLDSIEKKSY